MTQKNVPVPASRPAAGDDTQRNDPAPSEQGSGHDDGLLDSIGKAVTAPIAGAAEPDEQARDKPPAKPAK